MQGYQCKCGNIIGSNTGEGFHDCEGCEKCKTTFAHSPSGHRELKPHNFITKYNENTGKTYKMCKDCNHIDRDSYNLSKIKD